MKIRKLDGSSVIEINAIDSRLKMAVDAEAKGQMTKARTMLEHALKAERDIGHPSRWAVAVDLAMAEAKVVDYGTQITDEDIKNLDWGDTTPRLG